MAVLRPTTTRRGAMGVPPALRSSVGEMPQDAASPLGVTGQPLVAGAFGAGDMQGGEGGVVAQAELSGLVEVAAGQQPWVVGEGEGEIVDRACGSSGPPRPHIPWGTP